VSSEQNGKRTYSAPAAACAAQILRAFRTSSSPLSLADIERQLEQSKSLIYRVLHELVDHGFVARDLNGRYRLGIETFEMGTAYLNQAGFTEVVREILQELAKEAQETVNLGLLRGGEVMYVMKFVGPSSYVTISRVGGRVPANCIAVGKALLARLPDSEIRKLLTDPLPQMTPNSISSVDELIQSLAQVRETGYGCDVEEAALGRCGLAVAVKGVEPTGELAALSVSTDSITFPQRQAELLELLRGASDRIEREAIARSSLSAVGGLD